MSLLSTIKHAVLEDDPENKTYVPPPRIVESAGVSAPAVSAPALVLPADGDALRPDVIPLKSKVYPTSGPLPTFVATLESLKAFIPDESARARAALGALAAQGIQPRDVGAQVRDALAAIQTETEKFNNQKNLHLSSQVEGRKTQIEAKNQQILDLTAERDKLASELVIEQQKSDARTAAFARSSAALTDELNATQSKLGNYIL